MYASESTKEFSPRPSLSIFIKPSASPTENNICSSVKASLIPSVKFLELNDAIPM